MEPKVGDRISIDAKKVGQPRRSGLVEGVTKGISGIPRFEVRWDDGAVTVIAPGAGILLVDGPAKKRPGKKGKAKAKAKAEVKAKKGKAKAKAKAEVKAKKGKAKKGKAKKR